MRLVLLFLLLAPLSAQAQLVGGSDLVLRGEPVTVSTLTPEGVADTLTVIYRPNAILARAVHLPTGGAETVTWTPESAGVVQLVAGSLRQNVSVRYRRPPLGGIIVLILAGSILFGGATFAFRKLFQA